MREWLGQRNEERYRTNALHGQGYDELVSRAEELLAEIPAAFEKSGLPEQPNRDHVNRLLVEIRNSR